MNRSGAPGAPGTSAPSTSPAMRSSTVRAFVTRSALRATRSRTPTARTTAPYSATKTSALTANATKASRSVKPPRPAGCSETRVSRRGRPIGLVHQRVEALLGGRVAAAVETVEVERLLDALQVGDYLRAARVVGAANHLRRDQRGEQPQDEHHH